MDLAGLQGSVSVAVRTDLAELPAPVHLRVALDLVVALCSVAELDWSVDQALDAEEESAWCESLAEPAFSCWSLAPVRKGLPTQCREKLKRLHLRGFWPWLSPSGTICVLLRGRGNSNANFTFNRNYPVAIKVGPTVFSGRQDDKDVIEYE